MDLITLDLLARGGGGGGGGPRMLLPLLFLILFGFIIAKFIRRRNGGGMRHGGYGSPLQLLQERFANGKIDRAEYEHRKAVLLGEEVIPAPPKAPVETPSDSVVDDEPAPPPPTNAE